MKNLKRIANLTSGIIKIPFSSKKYDIKKGYKHRSKYRYYDNTPCEDHYQKEVYEEAKQFSINNNFKKIVDIGCGSAYKLMSYFSEYDTIGIDVAETYQFLENKYPNKKWLSTDNVDYSSLDADIVICADVIEHLLDPMELIQNIKKIKNFKYLFISTPERNILNGCYHYGPPKNYHHIREWSGWEFNNFISKHFEIISHKVSNYKQCTQLIVCTKKESDLN